MQIHRRQFLVAAAAGTTVLAVAPAMCVPLSRYGLDAGTFGIRPGATLDQTASIQAAINQSASTRVPLVLAPGVYRVGMLTLPAGTSIIGSRGATQLHFSSGTALLSAAGADTISLSGLVLNGHRIALPQDGGLINFTAASNLRITDCSIVHAGGNGMMLQGCDGIISSTTISGAADTGLFSRDGLGLTISSNIITDSGNGGIRVWQTESRDDGSSILDNVIKRTSARGGGTGENGNAINVFQANNVIVRGNHIDTTTFSAIRGNNASNIQITGNNCTALGEVAIYSEFGFEGAVIAENVVDGAAIGVSVTNYNDGGRLATVQGNIIRNLVPRPSVPPQSEGIGITVEADTAVTGNVIENATNAGISAGFGKFLRDVTVTGNVVRSCGCGVAVSVTHGAGDAVITSNMISGATRGAILGMSRSRTVTGDLSAAGAALAYPQLKIADNQVL